MSTTKITPELEYAQSMLADAEMRRDRISGALTVRRSTVRKYWDFLAGIKGAIAAFSKQGRSTAPLRVLYREKLADLKEHEQMVRNLKGMYKEVCDEVWTVQKIVTRMED
ncbi:MAG: hypothetical protein ACRC6V_09265 [Bacteroidales bacterium]